MYVHFKSYSLGRGRTCTTQCGDKPWPWSVMGGLVQPQELLDQPQGQQHHRVMSSHGWPSNPPGPHWVKGAGGVKCNTTTLRRGRLDDGWPMKARDVT